MRIIGPLLICLSLAACGDAPVVLPSMPLAQVQVTDSAGIRISLNSGGVWTESDAWRVRSRPALRVGEALGAEEYTFYGLGDATRTSDGRIAVLNRGTPEVRIYSGRGRHLVSFGSQGEGPGDFLDPARLEWIPGDSLLLWDQSLSRIYVFSADGELGRSTSLPRDRPPLRSPGDRSMGMIMASIDGYSAGSLLVEGGRWYEEVPSERWVMGTTELLELGVDGSVGRSLGVFPRRPSYFNANGGQPVHFAATSVFRLHRDRLYFWDGDNPEVKVFDRSGELLEIIRMDLQPRPATEADLVAFKAAAMERMSGSRETAGAARRQLEKLLDEIPALNEMPYFSDLFVDPQGYLWVQSFTAPGEPDLGWMVFAPEGQLLGRVALPQLEQVFEIGDTWILGRERDADGVERLIELEIIKPGH